MDLYSIDFSLNEISLFRQLLDIIDIKGKDAKYIANLQIKLENEINQINISDQKKQNELKELINQ